MPQVSANGIELEYESMGDGEPLLLIQGLGGQLVLWDDRLLGALVDRGYRVIRFDNRDVGLSSKLDAAGIPRIRRLVARSLLGLSVEAPYTLLDMADDAAGLLRALGIESAHVLGMSMGGMIAQTLALLHPHRVKSLTSVMSHSGRRWTALGKPHALRQLFRPPPRGRDEAIERHVELFRAIGSTGHAIDEEWLRTRAARAYDRDFHPPGFVRQLAAILATGSRHEALRFVRAPTLVVHGEVDPLITPAGGAATARAIPGARLLLIPGMGHDLPRAIWPQFLDAVGEHTRAASAARTDASDRQRMQASASG